MSKKRTTAKNKAKRNIQKKQAPKFDAQNKPKGSKKQLSAKEIKAEKLKQERYIQKQRKKQPSLTRQELLSHYRETHKSLLTETPLKAHASSRESSDRGSLLQQYKDTKAALGTQSLPTMTEVGWANFKQALDELPDEIQIDFKNAIDWLVRKYGEEPVAYYLNQRGLLETTSNYFGINYKSMVARMYLYQLAKAVEEMGEGSVSDLGDNFEHLRDEAIWSIRSTANKKNMYDYEWQLDLEHIQDINLEFKINEYFDSDAGEDYR